MMKTYNKEIAKELEEVWDEIRALPDINPDYPMDRTIHISRYGVQQIIYNHLDKWKETKVVKNYIDGKGNYHNEQNLTLRQIYDSGVKFGCEVTAKGIIDELEKIHEVIRERLKTKDESQFDLGRKSELAYLGNLIDNRISELKGENK